MILAGDVGGTNTRLALFTVDGDRLLMGPHQDYRSRDFASLEDAARIFVASHAAPVEAACFGIAGPVIDNKVTGTNLAWVVDARQVSQALEIKSTMLLNDLVAYAYGALEMRESDLAVLQAGNATSGNRALIAAGTGLGEAGLLWHGGRYLPVATEGGHADFAPIDDLGVEIYRYLRARYGRVSNERVLSGHGLQNLYEFLRDTGKAQEPPALAEELKSSADVPATISRHGMDATYPICEQALDLFCKLYGAIAGNVALEFMATGGLYLGGGIATKILPKLQTSDFIKAFTDKGRLSPLLKAAPVWVIRNDHAGLIGAARAAAGLRTASTATV